MVDVASSSEDHLQSPRKGSVASGGSLRFRAGEPWEVYLW